MCIGRVPTIDIDQDALVDMCAAGSPRWSTWRSATTACTTNINQASAGLRVALGEHAEPATIAYAEWFNHRRLHPLVGRISAHAGCVESLSE